MKNIVVKTVSFIILPIILIIAGCSHQSLDDKIPAPGTTETPEQFTRATDPSQIPPQTSVLEEVAESASTPAPTTEPHQQTKELDIVENILGIRHLAEGYSVERIIESSFSLPGQIGLLPNGNVVITDGTYERIRIISNGTIRTLVDNEDISSRAVATTPDGHVCYSKNNGQIVLINPDTGDREILGQISGGDVARALASDKEGNIYAATRKLNLYRFTPDGERIIIATNLPYEIGSHISDMDIGTDGTVYVTGWRRFIAIDGNGTVITLKDDLQDEPNWCEVTPDNNVYITNVPFDILSFNPTTHTFRPIEIGTSPGHNDILYLSDNRLLLFFATDLLCSCDLVTNDLTPVIVNTVNSRAFAASGNAAVFLASPNLVTTTQDTILKSHVIRLCADSTIDTLNELTFSKIDAVDVDKENRLYLAADNGFYYIDVDGQVTSIIPTFPSGQMFWGKLNMAISPNGLLYCISSSRGESIQVFTVDEEGKVTFLPITFDRDSFNAAYAIDDVRIDVGSNGQLAFIVTARGSPGRGPFYQRVYRANADGTDLVQVASMDCNRTGGMVDISFGLDNDLFVLALQDDSERIYHIDQNNTVSGLLTINPGRDPKSIDVDPEGNVWFCTTVGVFRVTGSK
ncbi:hypothetical protein ACFLX4_00290 [Chloroflexota bacterium]